MAKVVQGAVTSMARGGAGVVQGPEGPLYVRGVLTGETVRVRPLPKKGRVRRAELVEVLEPSAERVPPTCPLVERCGGCPLMHASLEHQRALKRDWLQQALARSALSTDAKTDVEVELRAADPALAYRRRARLGWQRQGRAITFGFHRAHARSLCSIDSCPVLHPALDAAWRATTACLAQDLKGSGEVALALGAGAATVVLQSSGPQPPELYAACARLAEDPAVTGVALLAEQGAPARWGDPVERGTALDGGALLGTIGGFSQAHDQVNAVLVQHVVDCARTAGARVLELYAGHGNLTVALAGGSARYTAVEIDPQAVASCRQNLESRSLKASVLQAPAEKHRHNGPLDVVVLDPPRAGARGVLSGLLDSRPSRIVYVSCDPGTLGRDLGELAQAPYRLESATVFDMFPHTAELESVVSLVRT